MALLGEKSLFLQISPKLLLLLMASVLLWIPVFQNWKSITREFASSHFLFRRFQKRMRNKGQEERGERNREKFLDFTQKKPINRKCKILSTPKCWDRISVQSFWTWKNSESMISFISTLSTHLHHRFFQQKNFCEFFFRITLNFWGSHITKFDKRLNSSFDASCWVDLKNNPRKCSKNFSAMQLKKTFISVTSIFDLNHPNRNKQFSSFFVNCLGGKFWRFFLGFPEVYSSRRVDWAIVCLIR